MAVPIINPPVPLTTPIPGGFLQRKTVRIVGTVNPSPEILVVNLQSSRGDLIALHLNPRFKQQMVALNSRLDCQWDKEILQGLFFPFQPGQGFEILILSDSDHYKITINGKDFAEFPFRTEGIEKGVTYLSVYGDIMISSVSFGMSPSNDQSIWEQLISQIF